MYLIMVRRTKLMQQIEERYKKPLEKLLPEMYNEIGVTGTAQEFGVSKGTVDYWLVMLGVQRKRVALGPGEELVIQRAYRRYG